MTKHEAAVFTAFTGVMFLSGEDFGIFHQYAEKLLVRSIYTHELGILSDELRRNKMLDKKEEKAILAGIRRWGK